MTSSASSLLPSPPTSCMSSLIYQSPVAESSSLAPIEESGDSPSQAWTDCRRSCEFARDRDMDRLDKYYGISGFMFHLSHVRPSQQVEEYILSRRRMRFFIWSPIKGELQYIRTPWSLNGLHTALNTGGELATQLMRKWDYTLPGIQDMLPCQPAPKDWLKDPYFVLATFESQDFRLWDLYQRKPILFYDSISGDDDADFFHSEGKYYLYFPFHGFLYEVPEIKDDLSNLAKLGTAPDYEGLQLNKLGPAEFFGGRQVLDQAAIPPGWAQLPWLPDQQGPKLPARCRNGYISNVLTSNDGKTQIIEADDKFFMWFVHENSVSQIEAPNGLEEILRGLRVDSECRFVKE